MVSPNTINIAEQFFGIGILLPILSMDNNFKENLLHLQIAIGRVLAGSIRWGSLVKLLSYTGYIVGLVLA